MYTFTFSSSSESLPAPLVSFMGGSLEPLNSDACSLSLLCLHFKEVFWNFTHCLDEVLYEDWIPFLTTCGEWTESSSEVSPPKKLGSMWYNISSQSLDSPSTFLCWQECFQMSQELTLVMRFHLEVLRLGPVLRKIVGGMKLVLIFITQLAFLCLKTSSSQS